MKNSLIDPPINVTDSIMLPEDNFDGQLRIYLSYDYLPSRNFYLLSKNINELYEFVFQIIHNRPISKDELLIFEEIKTGNSIDAFLKILDKLNPPKSVWVCVSIVGALIIGHAAYQDGKKKSAETDYIKAQTEQVYINIDLAKSQIEKNNAETEKTKLETERLKLENQLTIQNISKDYRDKVLAIKNLKKINRKLNSIKNQIMSKPINIAIINGSTIYNNSNNNIEIK